jgi:hypothetical protein
LPGDLSFLTSAFDPLAEEACLAAEWRLLWWSISPLRRRARAGAAVTGLSLPQVRSKRRVIARPFTASNIAIDLCDDQMAGNGRAQQKMVDAGIVNLSGGGILLPSVARRFGAEKSLARL